MSALPSPPRTDARRGAALAVAVATLTAGAAHAAPFDALVSEAFACPPVVLGASEGPLELQRRQLKELGLEVVVPKRWPRFEVEGGFRAELGDPRGRYRVRVDVQSLGDLDFETAARGMERRLWGRNALRPPCRAALRARYGGPGARLRVGVYAPVCLSGPCSDVQAVFTERDGRLVAISVTLQRGAELPGGFEALVALFRGAATDRTTDVSAGGRAR